MNKNQNNNTNDFFSFLANTLSISSVIMNNSRDDEKASAEATAANTDNYFDLLASTLSISRVVA